MAGMAMGMVESGALPKKEGSHQVLGVPGTPMGASVGQGMGSGGNGVPWDPPCHETSVPKCWQSPRHHIPIPWGSPTDCTHVPLLSPPAHPLLSVPRLQEDQEETDMSLGDKCPGPAEGPDPEPKPRGLSESRGDLPGMGGVLPGGCCDSAGGRGSGQSSDPHSSVPEQEPGLEVSGVMGTPPWGGAPSPLGTARLQLPCPVTTVAKKLHPAAWPHLGAGATSASPAAAPAWGDCPLR